MLGNGCGRRQFFHVHEIVLADLRQALLSKSVQRFEEAMEVGIEIGAASGGKPFH
jgi:hypothetical protein